MIYEPMIWKSYSIQDKVDFLVEWCGCAQNAAEEYAYRDFESLPSKVRNAIEELEQF